MYLVWPWYTTSGALNGITCPLSVTPSTVLRAPKGISTYESLEIRPSSLAKEFSILMPSCRPNHACVSYLLLQHSISRHAHASRASPTRPTRQPAPPTPPPSAPSHSPPSPIRGPLLRRQLPLLFRTRVIADDKWLIVFIVNSPSDSSSCLICSSMFHCDPSFHLLQPRYCQLLCLQLLALRHLRTVLCPKQMHRMIFWMILFLSQSQHLLHILRKWLTDSWLLFLYCSVIKFPAGSYKLTAKMLLAKSCPALFLDSLPVAVGLRNLHFCFQHSSDNLNLVQMKRPLQPSVKRWRIQLQLWPPAPQDARRW